MKFSDLIKKTIIIILFFYQLSCEHSTEPVNSLPNNFLGQLDSDLAFAILKPDGSVWTWGNNFTGQLGNGSLESSMIPKQIPNLKNVVSIDLCEGAAAAADIDGNIWFWGDRLIWEEPSGYDTIIVKPTIISNLVGVKHMEIRGSNINILKEDGTIWQVALDHNSPSKYSQAKLIHDIENIKYISQDLILNQNGYICAFPGKEWIATENGGIGNMLISKVK